jgi:transcription elongation factor/antiterminator RfaH
MHAATDYYWYAVYTNPRAEKKVLDQLQKQQIRAYLPLQRTLKQWSDRKKWVEEPLFKSYLFVYVSEREYLKVLQTHGVVRFITFERKAVPIPPEQIEWIQMLLSQQIELLVVEQSFEPGDRVEVTAGSMRGMQGELIAFQGEHRVRVHFDLIGQSVLVNIPAAFLKIRQKKDLKDAAEKYKAWGKL